MHALVTGANGLIGASVVRALLRRGHFVRALIRKTSRLDAIQGLPIEVVRGDVLRRPQIERAARGCDVVFHTAGHFTYGVHDLPTLERTAVDGSVAVLEAAKRTGIRRVVVTSSSVVFGYANEPRVLDESSPIHAGLNEPPYVVSKVRQDLAVTTRAAELGIDVVLTCPTMVIGPFATVLGPSNGAIVTYLADPFRLTYRGGCNLVSSDDVGTGHVIVAERGRRGEHYVLASENLEWEEIHSTIAELAGLPRPSMLAGRTACLLAARAEEWRARLERRRALTTREQAQMIGRYYWYAHDKAAALGYAPGPARHALASAIGWLATTPHVSRAVRADMSLGSEVYAARSALAARESRLRSIRRPRRRTRAA
jgi:dihydroflavonol-4-reductase